MQDSTRRRGTRMRNCKMPAGPHVVLPVEESSDDFVTQPIQIKRAEVCIGGEKVRTQGGEVRGSTPEVQRRLREDVEVEEVQGERGVSKGVEPVGVFWGVSKGKRSRIGETKKGWVSGRQSEGNKSAGMQNLGVEGSGRGEVEAKQSVDVKEVETEYVGGREVQAEESVIMEEVQTAGVGGRKVKRRGRLCTMLKGKKLAKCKNKVKVNACAKDNGVEAAESSKMREIKNKNGKKSRKVDFSGEEPAENAKGKVNKPNKRGKKRKHSSCAESPEESLKIKAKSKTLSVDDEVIEVVDLSLDAVTSMIGSLIRGNSVLHIPFEGIESRRQAIEEQGWERAVVEDGDSEIQEEQEDDGGSEDLHDRSTEGVQAPSFDKVGVVQPGGDVQSVEVEVEEIACNQGQITGQDDKDSCEPHYQDTDTGGVDLQLKFMTCSGRSTYAVVIDNLEKDLTPLTATNFILKETNINCQAYIFPSMLTDMYTRGVIEVNSREEFIEFNNFLESTHQIIVSSHNRPWVMAGQQGEVRTIMPTSGGQQIHSARSLGELKVVRSGTPDYNIAKQLKENFIEFCSHGKRVLERLAWEEQRIESRWAIN